MKLSKIFLVVFSISFLVGVGLIAIAPTPVQAGADPCSTCYEISCYVDVSCTGLEKMVQKCYSNALLAEPCDGPFDCRCVDIGCGTCILPR